MSEKYKITNSEGIYFFTMTVVDWVDVFTSPAGACLYMLARVSKRVRIGLAFATPDFFIFAEIKTF
jgi:hypothetical protein